MLDLVEGGQHFRCTIDLTTGQATLSADGRRRLRADGQDVRSTVRASTTWHSPMSTTNCCCGSTATWSSSKAAPRTMSTKFSATVADILPQTSDDDPGDLAPAGIGARMRS